MPSSLPGIVAGVDMSLTNTGIVILAEPGGSLLHASTVRSKARPADQRFARYGDVIESVLRTLDEHSPALVAIEGYFVDRNHPNLDVAELGGCMRWLLLRRYSLIEVAPTSLKTFAASHTSTKPDIMRAVDRRWRFIAKNEHEADAYVLAKMAACKLGLVHGERERERLTLGKISIMRRLPVDTVASRV